LEIYFVLVEPAVPENIGAAARALKTMGFSELWLVNPTNHLTDKARWLAHGSNDILEKAKIFSCLEDALSDVDFSIGTTAKDRSTKQDYFTPEAAREIVLAKNNLIQNAAIVFGREESGLTNSELRLCQIASTITIQNPYPSLNLAQAVMLYAYVFSGLSAPPVTDTVLPDKAYSDLKANAIVLLQKLGVDRNENLYHRMLERLASANADDSRLLLSLLAKLLPMVGGK
jgi:tRNA/rRNA methyltransferase